MLPVFGGTPPVGAYYDNGMHAQRGFHYMWQWEVRVAWFLLWGGSAKKTLRVSEEDGAGEGV